MTKEISKVVEIDNCNKDIVLKALFKPKLWEEISPVDYIEAKFTAPNVLFTRIKDHIKIVNIEVEMVGELLLIDKGEEADKGRLIQFNVRNNENVQELEGNLRVKSLDNNKSKIGVFIRNFKLSNQFLGLFGNTTELILRTKITDMLRNLEKYCKTRDLKDLL
ncbi:MAG TPA: hypothetical protein VGB37_05050 [Candidatus Lokiarchaeia archaeon]